MWKITDKIGSYHNKRDKSKLPAGVLVDGSKNVVSTDGDLITVRKGYTILGASSSATTRIEGSFEWDTSSGTQRALRSYDDELEVLIGTTWTRILDGWTAVDFQFAVYWDTNEAEDILLFVNGDNNIYSWSGGLAVISSVGATIATDTIAFVDSNPDTITDSGDGFVTAGFMAGDVITITGSTSNNGTYTIATVVAGTITLIGGDSLTGEIAGDDVVISVHTITKTGTATWAEARFIADGSDYDKIVTINGTDYTYTGGESTTTLTGITPDPTGEAVASNVIQKPTTTSNKPASSDFQNDSIAVLNNQVWVGSTKHSTVYSSKVNNFDDFSYSSPRLVGEGIEFNLDAPFVGFQVQENVMYISAGKSQWYQIAKELSSDNTAEEVVVKRLKSGTDQGALSQSAIGTIKNSIVFLSNETTLDTLGRVESIDTPEVKPISDPIKVDFDYYTWTNAHLKYYKNNLYICVPANDVLLVYNIEKRFWEAPWTLPAGRLAIINDELCLHSDASPETYKLFDGYKDNGNPVNCIARFSYQNFGIRPSEKSFNEWYNEGYIQTNTTLTGTLYYDYRGVEGVKYATLEGTDSKVLSQPGPGGIGKSGLGKDNFAGGSDQDDLRKFRWINEESELPFYEMLVEYSTNEADYRWSILAFGPDVNYSDTDNGNIKS